MNNELIDLANEFYYLALKNLNKLKDNNIYDELVYIVILQELILFKKTIKIHHNNNELDRKLLNNIIIMIMRHISYSSFINTINIFDIKYPINKSFLKSLELSCKVISCTIKTICTEESNKYIQPKFIKINKTDEFHTFPNIFNLNIPLNTRDNSIQELVISARFKQDWIYLQSSDFFNKKLLQYSKKNNKKLLQEYSKIIGIPYLLFSNKYSLHVEKLLINFIKNKNNKDINNLYEEDDNYHNILEYIKLFFIDNQIDKSIELYKKLINVCDEDYIKELLPNYINSKIISKSKLFTIPQEVQEKIKEKEEECNRSPDYKPRKWLDSINKIPFGIYKKDSIFSFVETFLQKYGKKYNWNNFMDIYMNINKCNNNVIIKNWKNYLQNREKKLEYIKNQMDESVYGHKEVKNEIIQLSSEWMNGNIKGQCIGIHGPPGNGKTSIAKNGICKAFVDEHNNPFPCIYISLGAANNGSYLFGHHYTFQGSTFGQIAEGLMKSKCMNPIFYFDELDKISQTESGRELVNTLIHITDFTQNDNFEDIYFSGIKLDISKCLFIFSFNDISSIDRVLRDRLHIIHTNPLTISEKIVIGEKYLLKEICKNIGWNIDNIKLKKEILQYIIKNYTFEAGVRKLKTVLTKIIRYYNHNLNLQKVKFPLDIDINDIDKILDINNKIRIKNTHDSPQIGLVNGLYCIPDYGIGGALPIQAKKTFPKTDNKIEISITGNLGKVMKESVECAKTTIWKILSEKQKKELHQNGISIHLHALDGATPKEGPSAGAAITLCLYSLITNKKVLNNLALTGEITLDGKVTAIGGVPEKVNGGHGVGCNIILLPEENKQDYNIALKNGCFNNKIRILSQNEYSSNIYSDELCVKFVETIYDIIDMALI